MTVDIDRPLNALNLAENEELMNDLCAAIAGKTEIPEDAIDMAVHFNNAATEQYLDSNHFVVCIDHTFKDKVDDVRAVVKGFGLTKGNFTVSIGSVFLQAAAQPVLDNLLSIIKDETNKADNNTDFGTYGVWGVAHRPNSYVPNPKVVLWYSDFDDMKRTIESERIPAFIEIDNQHGANELVDIIHTFMPKTL